MANNIAFSPMGKTYSIACPTANTAVTIQVVADSPCNQYMIGNHDTNDKPLYVRISATNNAAVLPTANGSYGLMVPADTVIVLTGPQCGPGNPVYVSAIGEDNNVELYVTPGEGL